MEFIILVTIIDKAGRENDELWRGIDGFALRFPSEKEANQYAQDHISKDENDYKIIEY